VTAPLESVSIRERTQTQEAAMGASTAGTQGSGLPPSLALYQMAIGHYFSRALCLAVKLGIADLLKDGPRSYRELAEATATHAPSLNRMLRLLASAGVFAEEDNGRFALTPLGQYLRSDLPGSARYMLLLFAGDGVQDAWRDLEYCVRTGNPAFKRTAPDSNPFAQIAENPQQAAVFDEAMATFAPVTAAAMAAAYDFSAFRTIVDVGGGNGALLIGILKACPNLRGIVFDRPDAAARARTRIADAGLASRCEAVGGDFFESVPRGADAYLLKHVIHDWDDEKAAAILRNCRRAMSPQARLLIAEGIYPPRIEQSEICRGAAANDLNMLVATGGRQRSEAEFRALYSAAGFRLTKIVPTPARLSVIEGEPAAD
jgi:predicted O-methyltransferase YrrM